MTRKPKRPHNPATAEHARQQRLEREAEARRMEAQGATVTKDKRTGEILGAHRPSYYKILLRYGAINQSHYDAAERLALDWAIMKGLDGRGEIDITSPIGGSQGASKCPITDRMLEAHRRVNRALEDVGRADRMLLSRLTRETVEEDRPDHWRKAVEELTQETREKEQREKVVCALENLRWFYEGPRRAA